MIKELELALKKYDDNLKKQRRVIAFLDDAIKKAAKPRSLSAFTRREKFIERRINKIKYSGTERRKK